MNRAYVQELVLLDSASIGACEQLLMLLDSAALQSSSESANRHEH
jgi:hypothetical protein